MIPRGTKPSTSFTLPVSINSFMGHSCQTRPGGAKPGAPYPFPATSLANSPTPSTFTTTRSPGATGPIPEGVPVEITSPGNNVMTDETNATSSSTPKISSRVLEACRRTPLTQPSTSSALASRPTAIQGPSRGERVEAFAPRELDIAILQVPSRDVVHAREPQDVLPRGSRSDSMGALPDDDPDLCLVVDPSHTGWNNDRDIRPYDGGRRLEEDHRLLWQGFLHLGRMITVVQTDGDDLRGFYRAQEAEPGRGNLRSNPVALEDVPLREVPHPVPVEWRGEERRDGRSDRHGPLRKQAFGVGFRRYLANSSTRSDGALSFGGVAVSTATIAYTYLTPASTAMSR